MTRTRLAAIFAVLPFVAGLTLASAPAQAEWRGGHGYGYGGPRYYGYGGPRYYGYHRGPGVGAVVGGALLGLGVGSLLAAPAYAVPPPVIYAPPPPYYPAPAYAPAYAAPPAYYPPPYYPPAYYSPGYYPR